MLRKGNVFNKFEEKKKKIMVNLLSVIEFWFFIIIIIIFFGAGIVFAFNFLLWDVYHGGWV